MSEDRYERGWGKLEEIDGEKLENALLRA